MPIRETWPEIADRMQRSVRWCKRWMAVGTPGSPVRKLGGRVFALDCCLDALRVHGRANSCKRGHGD